MAIPSMLEIIKQFNACSPAQSWASDMDVQEGWYDCVEPGWLMLLLVCTQNHKNAIGLKPTMLLVHDLIQPATVVVQDLNTLALLQDALNYSQNPSEDARVALKAAWEASRSRLTDLAAFIRFVTSSGQSMPINSAAEYMACAAINQYTFAQLIPDKLFNSGQLVNAAVDSSVISRVAVKYQEVLNSTFQLPETTHQTEIKALEAEIKVELCHFLRTRFTSPFTKFE